MSEQLGIREFGKILGRQVLVAKGHFVNASAGAMNTIVFMTLTCVLPIKQIEPLVMRTDKFNASKPGVCGFGKIRIVFSDIAVAFSFQSIAVDSQTVKIAGQ